MGKRYTVHFEGKYKCNFTNEPEVEIKGYYSQKQPDYHWSFTEDINKAKLWKTKKGAQDKIDHQLCCSYRTLVGTIVEIEVEEMKII